MDLLSAIVLLVIVTDPLGNLPIVMAILEGTRKPRLFILREVCLAFLVLSGFLFVGPWLLRMLGLSEEALQLSGGIILFIIAIKMIFPADSSWLGFKKGEEPILFPVAVPLIAGPSAVATVILFSAQHPEGLLVWWGAIAVSMIVSLAVLSVAPILHGFMGHRGLSAVERLMGMLLAAVAVEMLISAVKDIFLI